MMEFILSFTSSSKISTINDDVCDPAASLSENRQQWRRGAMMGELDEDDLYVKKDSWEKKNKT